MQLEDGQGTQKKTGFWHNVREWVQVIVVALLIALPVRYFIAEPFVVNGASMDPTFSSGQFLIVDRLTYDFKAPQRGDVIVFEYPNNPSVYYIKRIIGLPGETVSLQDGQVSITESSTATSTAPAAKTLTEPYIQAVHDSHETLPGTKLGSTEYFVMGDNRNQSSDSRVWGPLDEKFIVGRPIVRLIPINSFAVIPGQYHEDQTK
ncbi:MAG: signal peptidase I [Candidatus Paceibacterota bacterium]